MRRKNNVVGKVVASALAMAMVVGNFAVATPASAYASEPALSKDVQEYLDDLYGAVAEVEGALNDTAVELTDANDKVTSVNGAIDAANESTDAANDATDAAKTEVSEAKDAVADAKAELEAAADAVADAKNKVKDAQDAATDATDAVAGATDAVSEAEKAIEDANAAVDKADEAIQGANDALDEAKADAASANEAVEAAKAAVEAAKVAAENAKNTAADAKKAAEAYEDVTTKAQTDAEAAENVASEVRNDAEEKKTGIANAANEDVADAKNAAEGAANDATSLKDEAVGNAQIAADGLNKANGTSSSKEAQEGADAAQAAADVADAKAKEADAQAKAAVEAYKAALKAYMDALAKVEEEEKKAQDAIAAEEVKATEAVNGMTGKGGEYQNAQGVADAAKNQADQAKEATENANNVADAANDKVDAANEKADAAAEQAEKANDKADVADQTMKEANATVEEANDKVADANDEVNKAQAAAEEAKKQVADVNNEITGSLKEQVDAADESAKDALTGANDAKTAADGLTGNIADANSAIDATEKALDAAEVKRAEEDALWNQLKDKLDAAQKAMDDAADKVTNADSAVTNADATLNSKVNELGGQEYVDAIMDMEKSDVAKDQLIETVIGYQANAEELVWDGTHYVSGDRYFKVEDGNEKAFNVYEYAYTDVEAVTYKNVREAEKAAAELHDGAVKEEIGNVFGDATLSWIGVKFAEWFNDYDYVTMVDGKEVALTKGLTCLYYVVYNGPWPTMVPVYYDIIAKGVTGYSVTGKELTQVGEDAVATYETVSDKIDPLKDELQRANTALETAQDEATIAENDMAALAKAYGENGRIMNGRMEQVGEIIEMLQSTVDGLEVKDVADVDVAAAEQAVTDAKAVADALKDLTDVAETVMDNANANVAAADIEKVAEAKGSNAKANRTETELAAYAEKAGKVAAETVEAAEKAVEDAKAAVEAAQAAENAQAAAERAKAAAESALNNFGDLKNGETSENVLKAAKDLLDAALKAMETAQKAAEDAKAQAEQAVADYNASLERVSELQKEEEEAYREYLEWLEYLESQREIIEDEEVPLADFNGSDGRRLEEVGDKLYVYDAEDQLVKNEFSVFEDENGKIYMVFSDENGVVVKETFIVENEDGEYELVAAWDMNEDREIDFEEVFVYWAGEDGFLLHDNNEEILDFVYCADEECVILKRVEKEASDGKVLRVIDEKMYVYNAEDELVKNEFSVFEDDKDELYMTFSDEDGVVVREIFIVENADGTYTLVSAEDMNADEDVDFDGALVYLACRDGFLLRDDEKELLDCIYYADEEYVIKEREEYEE